MDVVSLIMSAENLRTLLVLVAIVAGVVWYEKRILLSESRLRKEMNAMAMSLRQEMSGLGASLRKEIDERFTAFHKTLKETDFVQLNENIKALMDERFTAFHNVLKANDFAHLSKTMKELTFMLQMNGILNVEQKTHIDSHLDE